MTISDALVAYRTYARAEGKSPQTIRWIMSSAGYFADFLGQLESVFIFLIAIMVADFNRRCQSRVLISIVS